MADRSYYCPETGTVQRIPEGTVFVGCCDQTELHRPATLQHLLADAFEAHSWEDRSGRDVMTVENAEYLALKVVREWLQGNAEQMQEQADLADGPTARTILIVKTDTIQQLAYAAAPDAD